MKVQPVILTIHNILPLHNRSEVIAKSVFRKNSLPFKNYVNTDNDALYVQFDNKNHLITLFIYFAWEKINETEEKESVIRMTFHQELIIYIKIDTEGKFPNKYSYCTIKTDKLILH